MSNPLERYQQDPCVFVREILGVTTNFPKQDEILRSVRDNPRTAVVAGNGCGKTVMAAEAVLWVAACYPESLVITTGPTKRQVDKQLWGEIHNLHRRARCPLGGELLTSELRFPKTGSHALGFSTTDGGRFEGWHAPRVFVVLDEAKSLTSLVHLPVRCWPAPPKSSGSGIFFSTVYSFLVAIALQKRLHASIVGFPIAEVNTTGICWLGSIQLPSSPA